jgi:selenocysteine lyase/cysteine desulfurase
MNVGVECAAPGKVDPVEIMTTGGDGRIDLDPATGLNRYHSAPAPTSEVLAYASSTANDISPQAFAHVRKVLGEIGSELSARGYETALEGLRERIRAAYGLGGEVAIVFAPSGTDLEYVALACAAKRAKAGTHNILLGADEVGSGCIHSAHGHYFADRTALGVATDAGAPVPGLGGVHLELVDIPVRDDGGRVRRSEEIAARMDESIAAAAAAGRHVLVHAVHGSKTGLILPSLGDLEALQARHGAAVTAVIDACQARITSAAVRDYLARETIVFVTGSKFMGGPPFSGFALVPRRFVAEAAPLPAGLATIFRRGEWPAEWPGVEGLPDGSNPGLLLRLEAAIFELERFQLLPAAEVERVVLAFHAAVRAEIVERTPARRVAPYPPGDRDEADTHPIEMRTLSTLDLSGFGEGAATFEDAQRWHKAMLAHGVRLGQPVKCVRLPSGGWGATLRIGLAMWQVADRAGLSDAALARSFADDMARVREALVAVAA